MNKVLHYYYYYYYYYYLWNHYIRKYHMQTTKVGSLQCSTIWLPNCTTKRLQHIQNATACLIKLTRKHDHVTPIPFNLHWLPVNYHMMFMIFLASSYMRNMLTTLHFYNYINYPTIFFFFWLCCATWKHIVLDPSLW